MWSASENILTDYGDKSRKKISFYDLSCYLYCVERVFGHGAYTTEEKMLFNMELIADQFYPEIN